MSSKDKSKASAKYDFSAFDNADEPKGSKYDFSAFEETPKKDEKSEKEGAKPNFEPSKAESALAGAAQGASFGFADELTAGVGAALDYVQQDGKLSPKEYYRIRKDLIRRSDKKKEESNPEAFFAGDLAGSVASSFVPGVSALNAGKGAKLKEVLAKSAALGGLSGAGRSEAENAKDLAQDVASSAALSGALGGALSKATKLGKEATKKLGKGLTGVREDTAEYYLKNKRAVDSSPDFDDIADRFLKKADELGKRLSDDSSKAYQLLKDSGLTMSKKDLAKPIQEGLGELEELGVYGPGREKTQKILQSFVNNIKKKPAFGGTQVGLDQAKSLVSQLDNEIGTLQTQAKPDGAAIGVLARIRKDLEGSMEQAPGYKEHMAELAEQTQTVKGLTDRFRSEKGAADLLKRIQRGNRDPYAERALKEFDKLANTSFKDELKDAAVKKAFQSDATRGSRSTLLGSILGSPLGAAGSTTGAIAGAAADKFGTQVYKHVLSAGKAGAPFVEVLQKAARRGQLAAVHQALLESDGQYRRLFESEKESETSSD